VTWGGARALALVAALLGGELMSASMCPSARIGRVRAADVPVQPGAQRLDGIAAVVGGLAPGPEVIAIYRSDVELRARLALLRESSLRAALGELPVGLLGASLTELINEALIAVEAGRLNLARPSAQAIAEERMRLLGERTAERGPRELLGALGVGERELAAWVERRALVNAFLQGNLEGTLQATDSELERLFESEAHPFRDRALDEVRPQFAAWVAQQRTERAVQRWVSSLSQRTPHRVLVTYRVLD
jgi:hypothetical protein